MMFAFLVGKEELVEVRFYDDWRWDDYQSGQGYVSTLPCYGEPKEKNPIGFLWKYEEKKVIDVSTRLS